MGTEYYDSPLIIDYFSKITENDGDIPFEKIEEIQKKMTAVRIKYRVKINLKT
jgi:hypothetical protein